MKIVQSESRERPVEIDETSSPTTVYVRENIAEITKTDEMSGAESVVYQYLEKQFTRPEWESLRIAKYVIDLEFKLAIVDSERGSI